MLDPNLLLLSPKSYKSQPMLDDISHQLDPTKKSTEFACSNRGQPLSAHYNTRLLGAVLFELSRNGGKPQPISQKSAIGTRCDKPLSSIYCSERIMGGPYTR